MSAEVVEVVAIAVPAVVVTVLVEEVLPVVDEVTASATPAAIGEREVEAVDEAVTALAPIAKAAIEGAV